MEEDANTKIVSNRPKDDAFHQQRLKTWQPILTPFQVIIIFMSIGIAFLPTGIYLINLNDGIYEDSIVYDGGSNAASTDCGIASMNQGKTCDLSFVMEEDRSEDLYVYYELTNFYQNHRLYVKSYSPEQLLGEALSKSDLETKCGSKTETNDSLILNPCGLIANSYFNDRIVFDYSSSGVTNRMNEEDIIWDKDLDKFSQVENFEYKKLTTGSESCADVGLNTNCEKYVDSDGNMYRFYYPNPDKYQYLYETYPPPLINPIKGVTDPHFIVWMRTAARSQFRKLYGIISGPFSKGQKLRFEIEANFLVSSFGGTKTLVISTLTSLGGRNEYIGISFVVVSVLAFLLTVMFVVKQLVSERRTMGDIKLLRWVD
jgi:hypothetical protein